MALLPLAAVRRDARRQLVHPHERWQDNDVSTGRRLVSGASQRPRHVSSARRGDGVHDVAFLVRHRRGERASPSFQTQDNSAEHPLAKLGASGQAPSGAQHWSGANGGPCNQLVLGVKPRVFPASNAGTW